jgi:hypothetical protein
MRWLTLRLVELPVDIADLALISQEQFTTRSAGLHVSAIINDIMNKSGLRDSNGYTREDLDAFAIFGRIWERYLAETMFRPPRYQRIGEVELDGIVGSPDAVDVEDGSVHEYKCTWKSSKTPIEQFNWYWWQIKAYCWMIGSNEAVLYPVFINGDWKPPKPVANIKYRATFSNGELKDNWNMLLRNAKEMV